MRNMVNNLLMFEFLHINIKAIYLLVALSTNSDIINPKYDKGWKIVVLRK